MKRASYRKGVQWIALNDNAGSNDREQDIAGYVSTLLLVDLFSASPDQVARDIMRARIKYLSTMANHPNRNWRRQWTTDLDRDEARHRSGLVVRFRLNDEHDSWEVAGFSGPAPAGGGPELTRYLKQALEVFVSTARRS